MDRNEFIEKLRKELSKLPEDEIEAAVEYYEEYFDEAGSEKEEELIRQLGSPRRVAAQIRAEYAVRSADEDERPSGKKGISAVGWVIIGICSAPVSVPVAVVMGAMFVCIAAVALAVAVSVFMAILAAAAGSLAVFAAGIMALPVAFSSALMLIGAGLAGMGIMAALGALAVIGVKKSMAAFIKYGRNKNEERKHKKIRIDRETEGWKYSGMKAAKKEEPRWKWKDGSDLKESGKEEEVK